MDHSDPATYSFDEYRAAVGASWSAGDDILLRWLARSGLDQQTMSRVHQLGAEAATRYRTGADIVEQVENLPRVALRGPYNDTIQDALIPAETRAMLGEVHGSGIWRAQLDERARYAMVYLLGQNGEFGVLCSIACTDGMLRVLRAQGTCERSREVIAQLEQATPDKWIHGAQFVTEIQGGSDAATNAVCATPAGDGLYRLEGDKWFCSNLTADYWMVTARLPDSAPGHRGVGLFCVPRTWQGAPNAFTVHRLKDKLGTRALPTAEMSLNGSVGWAVGPVDAGLKNMVAIVLTTSRIHNVVIAAAVTRAAVREATAYAEFRRAFGKPLREHVLIDASLRRLSKAADLVEAGAFGLIDAWTDAMEHPGDASKVLWARVMISVAKAVATRKATGRVYEAMMVLGGNGIEERFSPLPRLWRDAAIMETWEGPYTLLLMQALGDLGKYGVAGRAAEFLRAGLGDHLHAGHAERLEEILAAPTVSDNIVAWESLANELHACFETHALAGLSD